MLMHEPLTLWRGYAWIIPIATLQQHICHATTWMSGPKCDKAHFLYSLGWPLKREIMAFDHGGGGGGGGGWFAEKLERSLWGRLSDLKRELFGWKHPRAQILGKKGLEKKELKEEKMGFSLIFVYLLFPSLFSYFLMVLFSPLMN